MSMNTAVIHSSPTFVHPSRGALDSEITRASRENALLRPSMTQMRPVYSFQLHRGTRFVLYLAINIPRNGTLSTEFVSNFTRLVIALHELSRGYYWNYVTHDYRFLRKEISASVRFLFIAMPLHLDEYSMSSSSVATVEISKEIDVSQYEEERREVVQDAQVNTWGNWAKFYPLPLQLAKSWKLWKTIRVLRVLFGDSRADGFRQINATGKSRLYFLTWDTMERCAFSFICHKPNTFARLQASPLHPLKQIFSTFITAPTVFPYFALYSRANFFVYSVAPRSIEPVNIIFAR